MGNEERDGNMLVRSTLQNFMKGVLTSAVKRSTTSGRNGARRDCIFTLVIV